MAEYKLDKDNEAVLLVDEPDDFVIIGWDREVNLTRRQAYNLYATLHKVFTETSDESIHDQILQDIDPLGQELG